MATTSEAKIAVVTGASRGLGLMVATTFAAHDWTVVGVGRSARPEGLPVEAAYYQFDASDAEACEAFWRELSQKYPDAQLCLVNNAGGYTNGSLTETKAEDYARQMHSSYFTAVYMTRSLALHVPRARIINVISANALAPHKKLAAYGAAKAAETHFFQALQAELPQEKYQITNLYPSDIATQGPNPKAIQPDDLANFICAQAENTTSYYLRDATLYPSLWLSRER